MTFHKAAWFRISNLKEIIKLTVYGYKPLLAAPYQMTKGNEIVISSALSWFGRFITGISILQTSLMLYANISFFNSRGCKENPYGCLGLARGLTVFIGTCVCTVDVHKIHPKMSAIFKEIVSLEKSLKLSRTRLIVMFVISLLQILGTYFYSLLVGIVVLQKAVSNLEMYALAIGTGIITAQSVAAIIYFWNIIMLNTTFFQKINAMLDEINNSDCFQLLKPL